MNITTDFKTVAALGVVIGVAIWFKKKGLSFNPVNPDNVINRGFHAVYDVLTDGKGTLGTDIYDTLNDSEGNSRLNPANENNLVNTAATGIYQRLTGSKGSIGGDIYDWLHDVR